MARSLKKRPKGWPRRHAKGCPRSWVEPDDVLEPYVCNCGVSERRAAMLAQIKAVP